MEVLWKNMIKAVLDIAGSTISVAYKQAFTFRWYQVANSIYNLLTIEFCKFLDLYFITILRKIYTIVN